VGADPPILPLIPHEPPGFELLEVMPNRIERDAEVVGQLLGGERLPSFQLHQDFTPRAFVADRESRLR